MKAFRPIRKDRSEAGIALLIAIFVLLLISVVAIALIVSSNTESALTGNYRSSTEVYYAALGGIEEARARLRPKDPNSLQVFWPNFFPSTGAGLPIGTLCYLLNPGPNDNAGGMFTTYPDSEYDTEFGSGSWNAAYGAGNVTTTRSFWSGSSGPLYKWVRINAVSEKSLNLDVDADGTADSITPLYYDNTNPANLHFSNNSTDGAQALPQALELTALAVLPNGSQKILQYIVASNVVNLTFPAALTLDGNNVQFTVPNTTNFFVNGNDQGTVGSCNPGAPPVFAVGYTNAGDTSQTNIVNAIQTGPPANKDRTGNYTGSTPAPSVNLAALPPNLTTVAGLNALVQVITQNADVVINHNATQADLPTAMSSSNPMTIVVNGNLTFNAWQATGYGLLLVTGDFTFDPDASWDGIVLVVGTGKIYSNQGGNGQILGALFLARTLDAGGNPLAPGSALGSPDFDFTTASGSNGVYYSYCWIQASIPTTGYRILSFHEVSQ